MLMVDANLFQLMTEQVKDYAVFLLDPEGRILSWNIGAQKIKGYAPEEIIGKHFSIFYPPEAVHRGWPEHELQMARTEGRFEDEGFRVRKDGSRFFANVIITALRDKDGKLLAFSKITRDLSERRQQMEALRQSEERFRLLVEGVLDYAIYMLDPEGIVTSWNSGAERITGYKRQEILGKHVANFYCPEDITAGKPWQALAWAKKHGRAEDEGWRLRKDGERFFARAVVNPLYDAAGHLYGYAEVTQDLSQRRHLQELEATARKLNEFIALLTHEIRNPLAPIQTALLLMDSTEPDDPEQEKMRRIIERQIARLTRIAEDMVDVIHITRGELSIRKSSVDIGELVELSIEASAPWIERGKHRLTVELPPEKLKISGDIHRLIQVFTNLLNNAARYTPPGGQITVRGFRAERFAVLSIRDTGRGIPKEFLQTIFQMFVRGRTPLERAGEGLGVGLALARNIVELHDGTIEAKSEGEGQGSEFIVRLPLASSTTATAEDAPQVPEAQNSPDSRRAWRVLIVDDNTDAADMLDKLLKRLGHKTQVAHDGISALATFDEFIPDIVLLDIGLPGISGYEVARRMRTRRSDGFRIVAVTGWGQAEDQKKSAEVGIDLHLVKPVDVAQLKAFLEPSSSNGIIR